MINREDVRHRYGKHGEVNQGLLESTVVLYLATHVDQQLIVSDAVRGRCEQYAEDRLRDGLYGDIRQELIRIRGCIRNVPLDDTIRAICKLIDKLEWRE